MSRDANVLERSARKLAALRQAMVAEATALREKFSKDFRRRQDIVAGRLGQAKSPAARLALQGIEKSDEALWTATREIGSAGQELIHSAAEWQKTIRNALQRVQTAHTAIQQSDGGNAAIAQAAASLLTYADSIKQSAPLALDAALLLEYLVLVELHDANALYLGEKAWKRSKEWKAAGTLMEGLGEHAVDVAVTAGVTAAGFTPYGWAIAGVLAGGKAIYELTKSQVEAARKMLGAALAEVDKLYVLQQLNEQLTGDAQVVVKLLKEATAVAQAQRLAVHDKAEKLWHAQLGLDEVLGEAAELQAVQKALPKKKPRA